MHGDSTGTIRDPFSLCKHKLTRGKFELASLRKGQLNQLPYNAGKSGLPIPEPQAACAWTEHEATDFQVSGAECLETPNVSVDNSRTQSLCAALITNPKLSRTGGLFR